MPERKFEHWRDLFRRVWQSELSSSEEPQPVMAFDYENTPAILVWRDESHRVLRVFLAGNRPLRRTIGDTDELGYIPKPQYNKFRLDLVRITDPDGEPEATRLFDRSWFAHEEKWGVTIYINYISLHQQYNDKPDVLSDLATQQVIDALRGVLDWSEMPEVRFVDGRPDGDGNRWDPSN